MVTTDINVQSGLCNGTFAKIAKTVTSDSEGAPHVTKLCLELIKAANKHSN